jgi:NAD(P)-dependent dehydrogenase (short-subunit alcohol dehydrogenase family)
MSRFSNLTALITGGASGIGLATAKLLLQEGGRVAVTGRDPKSLAAARLELGPKAFVFQSDTSDLAAIERLAGDVEAALGHLDLVFLNAGIAKFAPAEAVTPAFWDETFDINLKGAFFTAQRFARLVKKGGSIVLNTSVVDVKGFPASSVYAASKAALRSLARTLSADLLGQGIRVNAVSPGPITTPIYGKLGMPAEVAEAWGKSMQEANPMKRFGNPDEVAKAVLFLAVDATYTTGAELPVDGGVSQL